MLPKTVILMWSRAKPRGPWSAVAGISGPDWTQWLWKRMGAEK